jgi:hypothetical protein
MCNQVLRWKKIQSKNGPKRKSQDMEQRNHVRKMFLRFSQALINVRECKRGESQENSQNTLKWESF